MVVEAARTIPATSPPRTAFAPFLAYVVTFHLGWIAWPTFVYPRLSAVGSTTFTYALLNISIRLLVWVLPVFLYLRYVDRVGPLDYLKLKKHVRRGIAIAAALTALNLFGSMVRFGMPHPSMDRVTWNSVLGTSILIGFIEEIPYRGFMLQKFSERVGFWPANLMTSLLFLLVHVPGWITLHTFREDTAVFVFTFGVVMAIALKYSRSLWAPIVTHSTNDFMSFILFRF
jgi:membrane protease YdiL (CAAX protease family)